MFHTVGTWSLGEAQRLVGMKDTDFLVTSRWKKYTPFSLLNPI